MKLRELFTDESKWTRKAYAIDKNGEPCPTVSDKAVAWSLPGALLKLLSVTEVEEFNRKIQERLPDGISVGEWYLAPERTFDEVKALLDELDI